MLIKSTVDCIRTLEFRMNELITLLGEGHEKDG